MIKNIIDPTHLRLFLEKVYKNTKNKKGGKNASYIPELLNVNPNIFGISIVDCNGNKYSIGDSKKTVAIESISKLFALSRVVQKYGIKHVIDKIGFHGSFLPFNSVLGVNQSQSHTINPFVNAGAMATTSLLYKKDKKSYFREIHNTLNSFANRNLSVSKNIFHSESETNTKNMALAYLLKSFNRFYGPVPECVDVYTKQCSITVSSDDIAMMASVFANNGIHPVTKKQLLTCNQSNSILRGLSPEGLYEYSDTWSVKTGVPAKSGVGGGILIVVPGVCGIGIVSPPLDKIGNSYKGLIAGEKLVNNFFLKNRCKKTIKNKIYLKKKTKKKLRKTKKKLRKN
jgi:glutaminase